MIQYEKQERKWSGTDVPVNGLIVSFTFNHIWLSNVCGVPLERAVIVGDRNGEGE